MHNGDVDIEFDPAKARANLRKHRVTSRTQSKRCEIRLP
jgi:hypothetical protein